MHENQMTWYWFSRNLVRVYFSECTNYRSTLFYKIVEYAHFIFLFCFMKWMWYLWIWGFMKDSRFIWKCQPILFLFCHFTIHNFVISELLDAKLKLVQIIVVLEQIISGKNRMSENGYSISSFHWKIYHSNSCVLLLLNSGHVWIRSVTHGPAFHSKKQ